MATTPNTRPLTSLDSFQVERYNPGAFVGGTANARGDHDGTSDPTTLFSVTGDVLVRIYGVGVTDLAGATATIEVGTANNTAALIAQTTATDIDDGDIWLDATPTAEVDLLSDLPGASIIADGADIVETIGTANITSGELYYVCLWRPVTSGSIVSPGS